MDITSVIQSNDPNSLKTYIEQHPNLQHFQKIETSGPRFGPGAKYSSLIEYAILTRSFESARFLHDSGISRIDDTCISKIFKNSSMGVLEMSRKLEILSELLFYPEARSNQEFYNKTVALVNYLYKDNLGIFPAEYQRLSIPHMIRISFYVGFKPSFEVFTYYMKDFETFMKYRKVFEKYFIEYGPEKFDRNNFYHHIHFYAKYLRYIGNPVSGFPTREFVNCLSVPLRKADYPLFDTFVCEILEPLESIKIRTILSFLTNIHNLLNLPRAFNIFISRIPEHLMDSYLVNIIDLFNNIAVVEDEFANDDNYVAIKKLFIYILSLGASPNLYIKGKRLLTYFIDHYHRYRPLMDIILEDPRLDVNYVDKEYQCTPLELAYIKNVDIDTFKSLIRQGADLNRIKDITDSEGDERDKYIVRITSDVLPFSDLCRISIRRNKIGIHRLPDGLVEWNVL